MRAPSLAQRALDEVSTMAKYVYSYGTMPPKDVFEKQFEAEVGKGKYHYTLQGSDAEVASEVGLDASGALNARELYGLIARLVEFADEAEEAGEEDEESEAEDDADEEEGEESEIDGSLADEALSLASSFLTTLKIEWI